MIKSTPVGQYHMISYSGYLDVYVAILGPSHGESPKGNCQMSPSVLPTAYYMYMAGRRKFNVT